MAVVALSVLDSSSHDLFVSSHHLGPVSQGVFIMTDLVQSGLCIYPKLVHFKFKRCPKFCIFGFG